MAKTFAGQIAEYYLHVSKRFRSGLITEEKFERLRTKLDEWAAYAERKEA